MVTVPKTKKREIITRAPFVHPDVGEIVAFHDEEGPTIDVTIRPEGSEEYAHFGLTAADAHQLADELHRIGELVQFGRLDPGDLVRCADVSAGHDR